MPEISAPTERPGCFEGKADVDTTTTSASSLPGCPLYPPKAGDTEIIEKVALGITLHSITSSACPSVIGTLGIG